MKILRVLAALFALSLILAVVGVIALLIGYQHYSRDLPDYQNLAAYHLKEKNYEQAAELCRKALSFRPDYHIASFNLGQALHSHDRLCALRAQRLR